MMLTYVELQMSGDITETLGIIIIIIIIIITLDSRVFNSVAALERRGLPPKNHISLPT